MNTNLTAIAILIITDSPQREKGWLLFEKPYPTPVEYSLDCEYDPADLTNCLYLAHLDDWQRAERVTLRTSDGRWIVLKDPKLLTPYELCECGEEQIYQLDERGRRIIDGQITHFRRKADGTVAEHATKPEGGCHG